MSRALARNGYEVSLAASGAEGVEMTRSAAFDLVAVDHYMPGQDGLATLEALRALPACPPIVYVTGSEESRIAVAALKSGAEDYVVKSIGEDFFDLLANSFEQVLDRAQLRRAREAVEAELRASNARLEAMLKEVNHRVANNLQMIMSFVAMQSKTLADQGAREALQKTQQRIATVAQVNRRLYTTDDVEFVAMDDYFAGLATDLSESWSTAVGPRQIVATADPIRLCTDKAVALGMIANEWVSNACKYAYPQGEDDAVRLSLRHMAPLTIELAVEDDGAGLPVDGAVRGTGLGTRLIDALARTHKADVRYESLLPGAVRPGTRAAMVLTLKQRDLSPRETGLD